LLFTHWEHSTGGSQDQFGVETVKPDGSGRREVTPLDVQGGEAVWSPDGALIAFQSPPDDEGVVKNLYTIRPDGTGMTALTFSFDGADADHPSWSPDGRHLVFSLVPANSSTGADLYVIDRDGGDPRPIAATTLNETAPSWSPEPS
jgi:TolB protein